MRNDKLSVQRGVYDFEDFMPTDRMKTIENMQMASDDFLRSLGYEREGFFYKIINPNEKQIAVFCHGGFGTAWITHLLGLPSGLLWPTMFLDTTRLSKEVKSMEKKLYKSNTDKKICGVCGGIAEYLNIDSTVVRLVSLLAILCVGCGLLAYIVAALVMPNKPE